MKMELIRKIKEYCPSTVLWGGSVVHKDPQFNQPIELIKLGVIVPNSDSYKEYLDQEEWENVDVPEGCSIFLFPKEIWENIDKMAELLLSIGIIC
jgi:hypothetical protein